MKNYVLFVAVLLLSGTTAFSQISGGLKAGANFASTTWKAQGESEKYSGVSFHVGGYANASLSEALSIQPELLYNSLKVDVDGEDVTTNYLSIPVMFMYGLMDNKFNIQAGPQIGFMLSSDPSEVKDEDFYKGTEFALNVGAGANFNKLNVTIRYCIGLSNIAGDLLTQLSDDFSVKNNNFQVSVGYRLFGGE